MIISKIITEDFVFYNLHAEQSVSSAFVNSKGLGIREQLLTRITIERVTEDFGVDQTRALILNFDRLNGCQNNLNQFIVRLKSNSKSLVLVNVCKNIVESLGAHIYSNGNNIIKDDIYLEFFVSDQGKIDIELEKTVFGQKLSKFITDHSKFDRTNPDNLIYHHSSSVYVSKYIDIKSMIASDKGFVIYCLYFLSLKIYDHWLLDSEIDPPTLICQNLNGSYISSILSSFLLLDVLILDKLGPINMLYNSLDDRIEENKKYLIVSDLVCLGTEVKIAKSLINFLGGKYLGNVSLIRIQTLLPSTKDYINTECIFTVSRDNNPMNYKVSTALDEIELK